MTLALPLETKAFALPVPRVHKADATVPVTIYGRFLCAKTLRIRHALEQDEITYHYVDLDLHRDTRRELPMVAGEILATPVIHIEGEWLKAPTLPEVQAALKRHGLKPGV